MPSPSDDIVEILRSVLGAPEVPVGLHEPQFSGNEWSYVKECLDTGWVSSVGSYVDLFGKKLAETCGVKHAIPTVNGTAALHVALMLAGVEQEDEILLPALTFVATANAVSYCGATPHFIECESCTLGVDTEKLSAYLAEITESKGEHCYNKKSGKRLAALVPVHIFGHPVDMDAVQAVAERYNIPVVTDAAEALGSFYKGKPAPSYGLLSAVSFNGNKIITTGGGGAILTDDDELAARARYITTTAKQPHKWDFVHDAVAYNYRMPNINAALGCAQLEQLDDFLKSKKSLARRYKTAFANSEYFEFMQESEYARSNNWLNAVILNEDVDRNETLTALNDAGYMCRPVWRLMHKLEMYKNCPRMDLSVSESMEMRVINIPSSAILGAEHG